MERTVAVFGGSFNPPGTHHRAIARELSRHFDQVVVVPSGPRPDKPHADDVEPVHRAAMADLAFRDLPGVRVDLFDLEQFTFTRTHRLEHHYRPEGEVWHMVGTDLVRAGESGQSFIQASWERGPEIWRELRFAVFSRPGHPAREADLPPHHRVFPVAAEGSSAAIRERAFRHEPIAGLVDPAVAAYIERYGLYRGRPPARTAPLLLDSPRPLLVADEENPRAVTLADELRKRFPEGPANCVLVVGGDGAMLHAIRRHWRLRLPFVGVNAGHRGFLLNGPDAFMTAGWPAEPLTVHLAPLLLVETEGPGGQTQAVLAFNDAWVERRTSQTAWIEVRVNGEPRLPRLVGDGALLATAAGSTAYARAMGATPVLFETPVLVLAGSNVLEPPNWKSVMLGLESRVEFRALDPARRPLAGFADGVPLGDVHSMRLRLSRIATAELAFCRGHDMAGKIAQLQFPPAPPAAPA